jgi:hypothetical protein
MDSIRSVFGVSLAHLVVLGALVPAYAESNDGEENHRRLSGRRTSHTVSHSREDYPVITNWLTSPDSPDDAETAK